MTPLALRIAAAIAADGPMRFDRYMERALFDPAEGYYASGRARIGRRGDFYTNVSVGRMFGAVIADQVAEVWARLGRPADFSFVEQGANDGRLAADVLEALREGHPTCFAATRATLVEPFAALAEAQRATLGDHAGRVDWVGSVDALPPFEGVHFTNEYADALPVRLFVRGEDAWLERFVVGKDGSLAFEDRPAAEIPAVLPPAAPVGNVVEARPDAAGWIAAVAGRLRRGLTLIVDYGFPRPQLYAEWRAEGTLSGYRAHRRDDAPLEETGEKDLTAHVDFTELAEAGRAAGLELAGFTDQYHFLVGAATPRLLAMETAAPGAQRDADLRALKTLLHPETMGTQFKYLALTRGLDLDPPLAGFRHARPAAAELGL